MSCNQRRRCCCFSPGSLPGVLILLLLAQQQPQVTHGIPQQRYRDLILTKADFGLLLLPHHHSPSEPNQRQSKSNSPQADSPPSQGALLPPPFIVSTQLNVKDGVGNGREKGPHNRRGRTYTDEQGATVIEGMYGFSNLFFFSLFIKFNVYLEYSYIGTIMPRKKAKKIGYLFITRHSYDIWDRKKKWFLKAKKVVFRWSKNAK